MVKNAVIVDAIRTASGRGKMGGALSMIHPTDLLGQVLETLVGRLDLDPALIDDVITGCVGQGGEQSLNIGRNAALAAGFPASVPATTVDRQCGSSQQAVHFAAQGVLAGAYDAVIACGVESMSRVPMGSAGMGRDPFGSLVQKRFRPGLVNQGISAELIAAKWNLSRDQLDEFAAQSHHRAERARALGLFKNEILPIETVSADGNTTIHDVDETVRPSTTTEGLGTLRPSFHDDDAKARFPQIDWSITAGNSSPLTDGASAVLITSDKFAEQHGLIPRAQFRGFTVAGDDPLYMLTAPIPATRKLLERTGVDIAEVDAYEVNEAFAPIPLAWAADIGADTDRMNPRGGAIALGHALGSSGTRLLTTLLNHLESTSGRYGLQTMCEGGGMANATLIERV